jgi:hypothetical protein
MPDRLEFPDPVPAPGPPPSVELTPELRCHKHEEWQFREDYRGQMKWFREEKWSCHSE